MTSKRLEALLNNLTIVESSTKGSNPKLERDLGQIALESNILKSRLNNDQGLNTTAHYFLAQSGANTQEISENLNTIDTRVTFQSLEQIKNTDIESYLKNFQKTNVIKTIEEARHNTRGGFLDRLDDSLHSQWKDAQQQILEDWDREQEDRVFGRRASGGIKQVQEFRQQLLAYAGVISEVNQNRLLSEKIPIIKKLKSLSGYTKCDKIQERALQDSWNIASNLSNELRENGSLIEGAYLRNSFNKSTVVKMNCSLIESGKSWLESEFSAYINDTLRRYASEAKVGGTLSVECRIQSFMKLTFSKNSIWTEKSLEVQNDIPIWLYVYLLIRSGQSGLAVAFADREVQSFYLSHKFPTYLKEYLSSPNKIVSEQSRLEILAEYQAMVYGSVPADPYKILLYKIIGRCELEKEDIPAVINTTEDFMWLELSLIREHVEEERYHYEKYRLSNLQQKISGAGPIHFDPNGSNPWLYFKVLLLSMQFEKAVEYLYNSEHYRLEAVHFGIAFAYYGLMRVPQDPHNNTFDLLINELDGGVSLNFIRLINQYVRLFISDDPDNALQYLFLISLYPHDDMVALCRQQIIEYVVKCKDHQKLIGGTNTHGNPTIQGTIEKYKSLYGIDIYDDQLYKDSILYPIAKKFQEKGRYESAVSVFELSERYTDALRVLIHQLDLALSVIGNNQVSQETIKLVDFCVKTKSKYDNSTYIDFSEDAMTTFTILLGFLRAFVTYGNKQNVQTIDIIKSTNVLPKENNSINIKYAVDRLKLIKNDIFCKHIPQILRITLDSYYNLYVEYSKHNANLYSVNQKNIEGIKNEVSIITSFLGSIDFDIPHDIFRDLNKKITCFGK